MIMFCASMRLSLGKDLMNREACPSIVCLCLRISSVSVGGIRKLIVKIPRLDTTLIGYWIAGQVRNMMRSVTCKSNLRTGKIILRRVLTMPCDMFLGEYLRNTSSNALLGIGRGRVSGLGDAI